MDNQHLPPTFGSFLKEETKLAQLAPLTLEAQSAHSTQYSPSEIVSSIWLAPIHWLNAANDSSISTLEDMMKSAPKKSSHGADGSSAANSDKFRELPELLRTDEQVIALCRQVVDAPVDRAKLHLALHAAAIAIGSLAKKIPGAELIAKRFEEVALLESGIADIDDSTRLVLLRRSGRHLLYKLQLDIAAAKDVVKVQGNALEIVGTWLLRRLFEPYQPSGVALARVRIALLKPDGNGSKKSWSASAKSMSLVKNQINLSSAIQNDVKAAAGFGLTGSIQKLVLAKTPVQAFNEAFLRRVANLVDFASINQVAANGGYRTLDQRAVLVNGRELIRRVRTGDLEAMLVCIEVISHLPSETAIQLPVSLDGSAPVGALAWIDLKAGEYCYILRKLLSEGARPPSKTQHLYEATTQVVSIKLTPPLRVALQRQAISCSGVIESLFNLLGDVTHESNAAVVGSGANVCTSRKIQESLPVCLIKMGLHRWPVALATLSHCLVASRKLSYGVCASEKIDEAVSAAYCILGWPPISDRSPHRLVGSFITPRPESLTKAFNFLCEEADASTPEKKTREQVIRSFNAHAHWASIVMALCYSLRQRLVYVVPMAEMLSGQGVHFCDKGVHSYQGIPVPTDELVCSVMQAWQVFRDRTQCDLREVGDQRSLEIASLIARNPDDAATEGVFTIDSGDRPQPVGWTTWADALPANLRLVGNFARQFWPFQLMQKEVEQLVIDILMRHQLPGLHPRSSRVVKVEGEAIDRLKVAMRQVILELKLNIPKALQISIEG